MEQIIEQITKKRIGRPIHPDGLTRNNHVYDNKRYHNIYAIKTTCNICNSIVGHQKLKRHQNSKKCKSFVVLI